MKRALQSPPRPSIGLRALRLLPARECGRAGHTERAQKAIAARELFKRTVRAFDLSTVSIFNARPLRHVFGSAALHCVKRIAKRPNDGVVFQDAEQEVLRRRISCAMQMTLEFKHQTTGLPFTKAGDQLV